MDFKNIRFYLIADCYTLNWKSLKIMRRVFINYKQFHSALNIRKTYGATNSANKTPFYSNFCPVSIFSYDHDRCACLLRRPLVISRDLNSGSYMK